MKAQVRDVGTKSRRLSEGTVLDCLNRSRRVFADLLQPRDKIAGMPIVERLVDEDGEVVLLLEDGSHVSY